jgi:hypothetical protein
MGIFDLRRLTDVAQVTNLCVSGFTKCRFTAPNRSPCRLLSMPQQWEE